MSKVFPQPYDLPSGSQPWAREVQSRIEGLELSTTSDKSELLATIKGLNATMQNLSNQIVQLQNTVAALDARKSVLSVGTTFNTGTLPDDSTFHNYGTPVDVNFIVPEDGRIVVAGGCGQVTISGTVAGSGIIGEIDVSIWGGVGYGTQFPLDGFNISRVYNSGTNTSIGTPAFIMSGGVLPPGDYIARLTASAWASGTTFGSVNFIDPYINVVVTSN